MVRNEELKFEGNEILSQYAKELTEDVKLSISTLREKSLLTSAIRSKWLNYLFTEQHNMKRAKSCKEKILKSKVNGNSSSILQLKREDKISENDENIIKLNRLIDITKENIEYLEYAMSILNDFGFTVKNAIEAQKLYQNG